MGYEKDSEKEINCPCGKGRIFIESWSYKNLNGGHHTRGPYIECEQCKDNYYIETKIQTPRPYREYTYHYLIKKDSDDKPIILHL